MSYPIVVQQVSDNRIFFKPLYIHKQNMTLSISPKKATFGLNRDYVTVIEKGKLQFNVIPINKSSKVDWQKINMFYLSPEQSLILKYENFNDQKKFTKKYENSQQNISLQKILETNQNLLHVNLISNKSNFNEVFEIQYQEVIVLQEMIAYAFPYMMGWDILSDTQGLEDKIIKTNQSTYEKVLNYFKVFQFIVNF